MAKRPLPTAEEVRQLLDYDPSTGVLLWKERPESHFRGGANSASAYASMWNSRHAGKKAGCHKDGYISIGINRRVLKAHRVIWLMVHGEWPDGEIDHINHIRDDNRLENLRVVTRRDNQLNHPLRSNNTSGRVGVRRCKKTNKWVASIGTGPTYEHLGMFVDFDDASAAREKAERRWGAHANHGH
jgi:hypothetical protein